MPQYYNQLRALKDVNWSVQTNLFDQTMNDIKHHFIMNIYGLSFYYREIQLLSSDDSLNFDFERSWKCNIQ